MGFAKKMGVSNYKIRLLTHKRYFDEGYGVLSYLKLVTIAFGITTLNLKATMTFVFLYALFCYIFGWAYIKYGWFTANKEIENRLDLFVQEMRRSVKKKRFR